MKLVQISVRGISYSETQTGAYALILSEDEGERKLGLSDGMIRELYKTKVEYLKV